MLFVELFAPRGTLSPLQRQHISERLVPALIFAEGAPPDLIERGREMGWLVVHEPEVWTVAGRPAESPRFVVRVNVPAGHFDDTLRAEVVSRVTRVLSEIDGDPDRLYRQPHAWIHLNEIPDGNAGAFGRTIPTADIINYVVTGNVPEPDAPSDERSAETVIDPICGMTVALDGSAITVEHNGTTYGFCSPACRDIFSAQHGITVETAMH